MVQEVRCPVVVGRDTELGALREAVERAVGGDGQTVFVLGEAGVGKSRVAAAAAEVARSAGMALLRGRAARSPAPAPYRPLSEAFSSALRGSGPPDGPATAGLRPAVEVLVPAWAAARGDAPAEPSAVLVGEAALALFDALGGRGAFLVLEDLQWADPETLGVLEYLADKLADRAAVVVATARSGEGGDAERLARALSGRRMARVFELDRLPGDDVARIIAASLRTTAPPAELVEVVGDRAGGLPLLVEELLASLIDSGAVAPAGHRWEVRGELPMIVPSSFALAVNDRLDAMPAPSRAVMESAAVLGEHFDWRLVVAMTGGGGDAVVTALRHGTDVALIEQDGGGRFRFRHSLTCNAVLDALLPPERARLAYRALDALGTCGAPVTRSASASPPGSPRSPVTRRWRTSCPSRRVSPPCGGVRSPRPGTPRIGLPGSPAPRHSWPTPSVRSSTPGSPPATRRALSSSGSA